MRFIRTICLVASILSPGATAGTAAAADMAPGGTMLVLDSSSSMWAEVEGAPKFVLLKDTVEGVLQSLPEGEPVGLFAYGHRRKGDCLDADLVASPEAPRKEAVEALRNLMPLGDAPIATALVRAAERTSHAVLVASGGETCEADPCAAAAALKEKNSDLTVDVIAYAAADRASLACIAQATAGRFLDAPGATELAGALAELLLYDGGRPPSTAPTRVTLKASLMPGGPLIPRNLSWKVSPAAGGAPVFLKENTGIAEAELLPGSYEIEVQWTGWKTGETKRGIARAQVRPEGAQAITVAVDLALPVTLQAPESALEAEVVSVAWQGPDNLGATIAVADVNDAPRESLAYFATGPARLRSAVGPDALAEANLQLPGEAGTYEVRYVLGDPNLVLARRRIEVRPRNYALIAPEEAPAASAIEVGWDGPALRGDGISIVRAGASEPLDRSHFVEVGKANPVAIAMPAEPGDYEIRYVLGIGSVVKARLAIRAMEVGARLQGPETAEGGSMIEVRWDGPQDWQDDEISVARRGSERSPESLVALSEDGERVMPARLRVPAIPGAYEILYIVNPGRNVVARAPLTITPSHATLSAPGSVRRGEPIEVGYTGAGYEGDRVVLVPAIQPDHTMWGVTAARGFDAKPDGRTGTIGAGLTDGPGVYELRYVTGMQNQVLARTKVMITE
ncbi:MAG: VWA domain-containing protein [Alphaproteobacteria bacterium]|nr:VWA domain-containing protein [Alphaproteobacteria bacterium]